MMNKVLCLWVVGIGLMSVIAGCAAPAPREKMDTDQIRQHSDEGFKNLQKEENKEY